MSAADILVVVVTVAALAGLGWFFFGPRRATAAVLAGGVQRLEVTVKGGYRPEVIRVQKHDFPGSDLASPLPSRATTGSALRR